MLGVLERAHISPAARAQWKQQQTHCPLEHWFPGISSLSPDQAQTLNPPGPVKKLAVTQMGHLEARPTGIICSLHKVSRHSPGRALTCVTSLRLEWGKGGGSPILEDREDLPSKRHRDFGGSTAGLGPGQLGRRGVQALESTPEGSSLSSERSSLKGVFQLKRRGKIPGLRERGLWS